MIGTLSDFFLEPPLNSRQTLTNKDSPRNERNKIFLMNVYQEHRYSNKTEIAD